MSPIDLIQDEIDAVEEEITNITQQAGHLEDMLVKRLNEKTDLYTYLNSLNKTLDLLDT